MKILHTADLHLKTKEQLSLVQAIIELAQREKIDLIIIAGDLFDATANGRVLETALLPIWEKFAGDILVVPGNHDIKYLQDRDELASNVTVANQVPYSIARINDIYFVCVPYQASCSLEDIKLPEFEPSILITHGTYGGSKIKKSYFPIAPTDVERKYRYVALGHYHTWFDKWSEGTLIVNPGAPRQTRKTDRGARYVSIINTDTWMMEKVVLPVSFIEYKIIPFSIIDTEEEIEEKLLNATAIIKEHPYAKVELSLQGSLVYSKYSISERIQQWNLFFEMNFRDPLRIHWELNKLMQISSEIMYASFTRLLVDKISDVSPNEVNDLAPFLFERLQQENQKIV